MHQQLFNNLLPVVLLSSVVLQAHALEFRSVAAHGSVFYDSPSAQAKKLFVASRGMPVEILVEQADWLRVRDQSGALAWVEKKSLANKRNVVVSVSKAEVRTAADAKAALLFFAEKGVLFDLLEAGKTGWVKVKHRDGAIGYIRVEEVWGV
ncbi:SH3 domain-containing protein [Chitinimonas sp. PSY-7]|uniref:SH3 domain-containing protein n=1 Tax=Chitinimonas sp. PSY-7 TaxID=3459088 RepID=UPI0040402BB9